MEQNSGRPRETFVVKKSISSYAEEKVNYRTIDKRKVVQEIEGGLVKRPTGVVGLKSGASEVSDPELKAGADVLCGVLRKRKASAAVSTSTTKKVRQSRMEVLVSTVSYAKYGLTAGSVSGIGSGLDCIIISKGWPGWVFGAGAAGLSVQTVIMLDTTWIDAARRLLDNINVIDYSAASVEQTRALLYPVTVVFVDVSPPGCLRVWELATHAVVTLRQCRRIPKEWSLQSYNVHHELVGGVTTLNQSVYYYTRLKTATNTLDKCLSFERCVFRDLGSIMLGHNQSGIACDPPATLQESSPSVVRLKGELCFHSGGWLPGINRRFTVITPCVFSKTGWCQRRLVTDEWLSVLDMPSIAIKKLTLEEKNRLVSCPTLVPLKIHYAVCLAVRAAWEHHCSVSALMLDSENADCNSVSSAATIKHSNHSQLLIEAPVADRMAKATKADDAAVPEHLWNDRLLQGLYLPSTVEHIAALDALREFFHRIWRRGVTKSYLTWSGALSTRKRMGFIHSSRLVYCVKKGDSPARYIWSPKGTSQYCAMRSLETVVERTNRLAAVDGIRRCALSTWWDWSAGSRPLFWRWPEWYQESIRDGLPLWLRGNMKRWCVPQRVEKDPVLRAKIREKVVTSVERGYLEPGEVLSLTSFFSVPKGDDDIRMVYDGTKSGFNQVLWAPWFPLPTIEQHLRVATVGCYMADIDIGEMFLNFVLHKHIRVFCGVDLTSIFPELLLQLGLTVLWYRWARCGMGFTSSPYQTVQGVLVAEEVILGDRFNPTNAFRFDEVVLNLPGMSSYNPAIPWVAKIRSSDRQVAGDIFIYVDDARVIGSNELDCWHGTRQTASMLNYLGLQDAPRKRRVGSREPGPWAGSICHSSGDQVEVLISQERWDKTKAILEWLQDQLESNNNVFNFKLLESKRGYLVYISRTYPAMCPYLKGIHQTLESWRKNKREDGWSMSQREIREAQIAEQDDTDGEDELGYESSKDAPKEVKGVERLQGDVTALQELISGPLPKKRKVRPSFTAEAIYGFGDASGKGFGSSFTVRGKLIFRHGQWSQTMEKESSNFRELANLVLAVEEASAQGHLDDCELFLFTDNTTAESAYYKGTSSAKPLFDLMLRLRKLQMDGKLILHVIHVAGTRMIEEGTDGLSRGSLIEGVMAGTSMLSHIPLHLSAIDRQPELGDWLETWLGRLVSPEEEGFHLLSPLDWYTSGQSRNYCIWIPPPAAADVAAELLGKSKHKRPLHEHVFICPRLMTNRWRKHLSKICDIVLTIPAQTHFWNVEQHEPLLIGVCFPLSIHRPWRIRGTVLMARVVDELSKLSTADPFWGRDILRELFNTTRRLDSMPECLVRPLLQSTG